MLCGAQRRDRAQGGNRLVNRGCYGLLGCGSFVGLILRILLRLALAGQLSHSGVAGVLAGPGVETLQPVLAAGLALARTAIDDQRLRGCLNIWLCQTQGAQPELFPGCVLALLLRVPKRVDVLGQGAQRAQLLASNGLRDDAVVVFGPRVYSVQKRCLQRRGLAAPGLNGPQNVAVRRLVTRRQHIQQLTPHDLAGVTHLERLNHRVGVGGRLGRRRLKSLLHLGGGQRGGLLRRQLQ